ncbi:MAG TPA: diguanylate cyclase [Candidatus Methylomirabilis sp.]|nr:diguanylate cyclase [Candidatus Methylomirabilis sp.]
MDYPFLISSALIVLGAILLAVSLSPTTRIIRELAPGPTQSRWELLRGFIVLFIAGYVVCLGTFTVQRDASHVVVSSIFFLGACFVLLVCVLAHGTVADIKRIATLEAETITDPLMEIYNRRHLERRLEEEFARARRYGFPLSLLLLDIDHFKKVNDDHGHPAGDLVLKGIGEILKKIVRNVDVPARYGGEEVAILLAHTPDMDAAILAERIRRTIEGTPFPVDAPAGSGIPLRCTVSIGVAAMTRECAKAGQLLQMADTAMYRAKQDGRNRTVVFRCGKEIVATAGPAA